MLLGNSGSPYTWQVGNREMAPRPVLDKQAKKELEVALFLE